MIRKLPIRRARSMIDAKNDADDQPRLRSSFAGTYIFLIVDRRIVGVCSKPHSEVRDQQMAGLKVRSSSALT
jgi:hypothetical protein